MVPESHSQRSRISFASLADPEGGDSTIKPLLTSFGRLSIIRKTGIHGVSWSQSHIVKEVGLASLRSLILKGGWAKEKALIRYAHEAFVFYAFTQKQVFGSA
jgi:hypothetical protein